MEARTLYLSIKTLLLLKVFWIPGTGVTGAPALLPMCIQRIPLQPMIPEGYRNLFLLYKIDFCNLLGMKR
ncbi:hypothetical protein FZC84_18460 [Rossellomorea vietnamensis]|uniref:Uncharacterized protein n=1 Tax=Rossellomorea vietnamensis TaxID=218284 RepID=A0A5D4M7N6_9BACI|nr:hypothetical protein [Rossellomorea vietnamensis]TYR97662.1 hypothetical protein FZC84_18460 [Rossellomorea vietnamensis]